MPADTLLEAPAKATSQASSGSAFPVSRGVIHVTPQGMDTSLKPASDTPRATPAPVKKSDPVQKPDQKAVDPKKKTSAREDMDAALAKKAGIDEKPATTDENQKIEASDEQNPEDPAADPAATEQKQGEKPADGQKKGKVNPWKLMDEHKKRAAALKEGEKAAADAQKAHDQKPDLKVQVVEAPKK